MLFLSLEKKYIHPSFKVKIGNEIFVRARVINFPVKRDRRKTFGVQVTQSEPANILTALTENERVAKKENDIERKPVVLARLFYPRVRPTPALTRGAAIQRRKFQE